MSTTRALRDGEDHSLLRDRADRCPGVLRPWIADDGALLRIRLVGGLITRTQLAGLAALAAEFGDGSVHLTSHANVQLRAFPDPVPDVVVSRLSALGLLPHPSHERVRNILVSSLTGIEGGAADVRPLAEEYDRLLCASADLASLSARFLVAFDDRGDITREVDLRALAISSERASLSAGGELVGEVALSEVPAALIDLARWFMSVRGEGEAAAWHISELAPSVRELIEVDVSRLIFRSVHPRFTTGVVKPHLTLPFETGTLTPYDLDGVLAIAGEVVIVTTERSLVLPEAIGC